MYKIIMILIGGSIGALSRYGLSGLISNNTGGNFPWGTITVNLCGCFIIGFLWKLANDIITIPVEFKALIFIGFLGAFTTFSTYGLETLNLLRDGEYFRASINILINNIGGIILVFTGYILCSLFSKIIIK